MDSNVGDNFEIYWSMETICYTGKVKYQHDDKKYLWNMKKVTWKYLNFQQNHGSLKLTK